MLAQLSAAECKHNASINYSDSLLSVFEGLPELPPPSKLGVPGGVQNLTNKNDAKTKASKGRPKG